MIEQGTFRNPTILCLGTPLPEISKEKTVKNGQTQAEIASSIPEVKGTQRVPVEIIPPKKGV